MIINSIQRQICEEFSKGNFEFAYEFLNKDITWNIIGNELLTGKEKVIEFCQNTSAYFKEVETDFRVNEIIVDEEKIVVTGTAVFINKENKKTEVSSCDIYRFDVGFLNEITSYCIITSKDR